jgi:single-strand DNA-binding protein
MNLNRAMIIGNLTRDPEVRTTATGQTVANFGVATNHVWKDQSGQKQEKVEFHNIVVWGKLAEICGQYLGKGRKVYVEGRLQTREWEDKEGGKRKTTEIVADNMIMLDRGQGGASEGAATGARRAAPAVAAPAEASADAEEIRVEDIPF